MAGAGRGRVYTQALEVLKQSSRVWRSRSLDLELDCFTRHASLLGNSCRSWVDLSPRTQKSFTGGVFRNYHTPVGVFQRAFVGGLRNPQIAARSSPLSKSKFSKFSRDVTSAIVSPGGTVTGKSTVSAIVTRDGHTGKLSLLSQSISHYGKCYFDLSKARLSSFVVLSAAVGYWVGSGELVDWTGLGWTSVGTMLCAASANSFNQLLEIANDARMKRTMRRPLPSGRIGVTHALAFAVTAGVTGVTLLASKTNALTAELGAANIVLYSLVYTPLKQLHFINTWVGAVVGAIPPLMGWAAAAGRLDAGGWVLASALYFWQLPHFMALAFFCRHDYAAGGYKMLSLLDASGRRTASCALRNCLYLLPLGFIAQHFGVTSGYFGWENLLLTSGIGAMATLFYLKPSPETARRLFRSSLIYLPFFMSAMVFHRVPQSPSHIDSVEYAHQTTSEFAAEDLEDEEEKRVPQSYRTKNVHRPPIAFISYAPFPFLPAPDY
ncbi:hypothetical protein R1sor_018403 [Riccia sorocarpa]|uniref:Heme O synthase n=1 Tax=Riccia sorocarpa TaxID=122646 RepID=A0ABD3IAL7_9MARC